jgi:putative inorganic carbon (HCO3(-)) transporter
MSRQLDKQRPGEPQSLLWVVSLQLGLLLLVFYYTFIGGQTALGVYDHTWRAITQWVTSALITSWLLWRWLSPRQVPRGCLPISKSHGDTYLTSVDWPLLWLLLAWTLSIIFSVNPFRSQEVMVFFITYLFFFFMAVDLARRPWLVELTINAILGAAGLMWTLALLQISWWYADQLAMPALLRSNGVTISLSTLPRLSVLGNPNTMAAYLVPIIPLTLHKLATVSRWISRLLLTAWGMMLIGVLILTQSRGGLIGLAAILVYYGIILTRRKGLRPQVTPSDARVSSKILRAGGLALAVILISYGGVVLSKRGFSAQDAPIQVRIETMAGALKTLAAHPLVGSGPGTLGEELLRHQYPLREIHSHAHNLLLTFAAETGLIGCVGMAWLGMTILKRLRSTKQEMGGFQLDSLRVGLTAALAGLFAHNMVDSFFGFPVVMLLASLLFGFWIGLDSQLQPLSPRLGKRTWIVNLAASAVLVVITVFGLRVTSGLKAYNQAVRATAIGKHPCGIGDWTAAVDHLQEAIALSPQSRFYRRQLGFAYGYLATENPVYRPQAIAYYQETLRTMDRLAFDHANFSCLLWENGEQAQAIQEMTRGRELDPNNNLYHLNLGRYLEAQGHYDQAWDEYARALSHGPRHLHSDYWERSSLRKEHMPTILERAIEETIQLHGANSLSLARLYTYAGYFTEALRVYDQLQGTTGDPSAVHIGRAEVWLGMGELDQALVELETAIAQNPWAALAYHYRGSIYLEQNQLSEAVQNTQAALFLAPTPASYYQSGRIAEAQGDMQTARQQYEAAFSQATLPFYNRYVTEVAGRIPFAEEWLPCLIIPRITDELVLPTLAEGNLLEREGHFAEAVRIYRRLLSYEPDEPRVKGRLEELCRQHPDSCQVDNHPCVK